MMTSDEVKIHMKGYMIGYEAGLRHGMAKQYEYMTGKKLCDSDPPSAEEYMKDFISRQQDYENRI